MNLYAESSAVVGWLLGEPDGLRVLDCLVAADTVVASELTLVECDRVLIRAVLLKTLSEAAAADRRAELYGASALWHVFGVGHEVLDRARQPFPKEPIRTSDALHLATAILARSAVPGIQLLSLDGRLRASARRLGFRLLPEAVA
jgi:predicted nucleic acid-binding protein